MTSLNAPYFHDDHKAREYLESIRWPDGQPVCPHCKAHGGHYALKGKAHRPGLWKCAACRKQFSVTVGTVFERSKIPLSKWLMAAYLMCSSKKGISAHQLHRMLGVTYKTAWFLAHRIRHAMSDQGGGLMGEGGGTVEADETYLGKTEGLGKGPHLSKKQKVVSLVHRGGEVRSFKIGFRMRSASVVLRADNSLSSLDFSARDTRKLTSRCSPGFDPPLISIGQPATPILPSQRLFERIGTSVL